MTATIGRVAIILIANQAFDGRGLLRKQVGFDGQLN
jgi:hypothetical protein